MAIKRNPFGNKPKAVAQIENGKIIKKFESISEATIFMKTKNPNANVSHISDCANGKIKSAYGYIWKFI